MKKAKIMLMGLAVCAVVSGALAFKSAKSTRNLFICDKVNNVLTCTTALFSAYTTLGVATNTLFTGTGATACTAVGGTIGCNGTHPTFATVANQ